MPELPEVETVKRGLAPVMQDALVTQVRLGGKNLRFPFPHDFVERLEGSQVTRLARRAKFLQVFLSTSDVLLMHLGMSGRFLIHPSKVACEMPGEFQHRPVGAVAHNHVAIDLTGPAGAVRVTYNDVRRFGYMDIVPMVDLEHSKHFKKLGPEPLSSDFDHDALNYALKGKRCSIKSALLDQRVVAGLGNIYVCEALFLANISPRRLGDSVYGRRAARLVVAIKSVLRLAIEAGGSSLRDFAATDGSLGYFQTLFQVYGRAGSGCTRCRTPIERIIQAGRSTFFCPSCQR